MADEEIYLPEIEGFEKFGRADTGGGYDWNVIGFWLKDGRFYWASDGGCSCYGEWEGGISPSDLEGGGSAHDAIKALHSWTAGQYGVDGSEALLTKLMNYRPEKAH